MKNIMRYRFYTISLVALLAGCLACDSRSVSDNSTEPQVLLGDNWEAIEQDDILSETFTSIASNDSLFVISGRNQILSSKDGIIWTTTTNTFRGGEVVYYGEKFYMYPSQMYCYTSENGVDWKQHQSNHHMSFYFLKVFDTCLIAINSGMQIQSILSSNDGMNWSAVGGYLWYTLFAITHYKSLYYGVGADGIIKTSNDAIHWNFDIKTDSSAWFKSITHSNDRLVAVSSKGKIIVSLDGSDWRKLNPFNGYGYRKVIWTGSQFIAVGGQMGGKATIITSRNGFDWDIVYNEDGVTLFDIECRDNICVAVGVNGQILISRLD